MKLLILAAIFILSALSLKAQKNDSIPVKRPLFFVSGNFDLNLYGKVLPSSGFQASLSINLARLFTKKIVLGLALESGIAPEFSSNRKYGYLTPAVNDYIQLNQADSSDMLRAEFLSNTFNRGEFKGCLRSNLGIVFSPFPDKYGEMIFFLSKGLMRFPFAGKSTNPALNYDWYFNSLDVPVLFKAMLLFKPLTLTKMKDDNFLKDHLHLGFYVQKTALKDAVYFDSPLEHYLNPAFFSGKRKTELHFGMRIGIGLGFINPRWGN